MKKIFFICCLTIVHSLTSAQFAPPAGQVGSTAIYKDSSVFTEWATGCSVERGYQDISNPSLGYASAGDSTMALGMAGTNGIVSLGDGGNAILTFVNPIADGPGWDFAVFENGFSDTFLELAYVEVSSDGVNYFRFPCTSITQDTLQIGSFGSVDATLIDNLAGKYRALYGTPFDLQQLSSRVGLNINAITHVKIIDVVGCIQPAYARYDQYGNIINELWNTPFASSGFDLDALGVIHTGTTGIIDRSVKNNLIVYPNPAKGFSFIQLNIPDATHLKISISDYTGKEIKVISTAYNNARNTIQLDISDLKNGLYFISVKTLSGELIQKLVINND